MRIIGARLKTGMKAKQIEKLLTGVMNNLIDSVTDDEIKNLIKDTSFITGGCIPSMLMDEYVNDYDIYFRAQNYVEPVKKYYEKQPLAKEIFTERGKKVFLPKLITENAINLTDKIQIIVKFFGNPEEVIQHFDWQHIKSYFSLKDGLVLTNDVYKLIVEKELVYTGSNYPLSSLLRLRKFLKSPNFLTLKYVIFPSNTDKKYQYFRLLINYYDVFQKYNFHLLAEHENPNEEGCMYVFKKKQASS